MNVPYSFDKKLVLRTPRLPVTVTITAADVVEWLKNEDFLEAIYLASPVLYEECKKWNAGTVLSKKDQEKITATLSKYYTRMNSRCTPFGLFSGCSMAVWDEGETSVVMDESIGRHTRLDMHYLCALSQALAIKPGIREHLRYFPNNSIYVIGDELRYVEYQYILGKRNHQISSVTSSDFLQNLLGATAGGATIAQMVDVLVTDDISPEEARLFVDEIIGAQLVVNELEPAITGKEFLHQVIEQLKKITPQQPGELQDIIDLLEQVNLLLLQKDAAPGAGIGEYKAIIALLDQLEVPYDESKLFQTDIIKNTRESKVSVALQNEITGALTILNKLTPERVNDNLHSFARRFYERYEDKEMPLLTIMDTETGIGYLENKSNDIASLVDDVYISQQETVPQLRWSKVEQFLHQKIQGHSPVTQYSIAIAEDDLKDIAPNWNDLPASMSVMFRLVSNDQQVYIESAGGASAVNLLGRFAHADERINELVCAVTREEQLNEPNAIYAEIIHLPESRIGNILLHPVFRDYEIPYLASSSLDKEHQVAVNDLYVSVRNNKVILRSKRLNKQIIPRLSTAHNYSYNALPVYQFLCDLQLQGKRMGLVFNWGSLEKMHRFLPRVTYGNTILHLAKWNLEDTDIKALYGLSGDELVQAITALRARWNLPQQVVLADGDNELLVDFGTPLLVQAWLETIKGRKQFVLKEFINNQQLVKNENGQSFANQFVAVLTRHASPQVQTAHTSAKQPVRDIQVQEHFSLGSEWLYYKVYCGMKSADKILQDAVRPLVRQLTQADLIDQWFFIRYTDPAFHLRLRFHLPDTRQIGAVIQQLHQHLQPYISDGYIWKLQTDSYTREINRYGSKTIGLAEKFFCHDSNAVLDMLDNTWGDGREEVKWLWALRAADELLNCLQFSLADKISFFVQLRDGFGAEFNMDKVLRLQLSDKYRKHKKNIELIMDKEKDLHHDMYPLIRVLKEKSQHIYSIADKINNLHKTGQLEVPLLSLVSSYVHMMFNRIITTNPRLHELVLYDFLCRYYQSVSAREKTIAAVMVQP